MQRGRARNELLGSLLAADLGLPVNEPFLARIEEDFIESIQDHQLQQRLRSSSSIAFASRDAGKQWRRWERSDRIAPGQVNLALAILAFDAFIGNNDRRPRNSNLLLKGDEWRLIDHEGAFGFRLRVFPPCAPWSLGNLELLRRYGEDSEHIFTRQLANEDDLDFEAFSQRWSNLSDARLAQYDALLPEEWEENRPILAQSIDHIKMVRARIDLCVEELRRVLS